MFPSKKITYSKKYSIQDINLALIKGNTMSCTIIFDIF